MNRGEAAMLLAVATAYDNRTISEAAINAWHAALDDVAYTAARDGIIAHYRLSTDFVMPGHVREQIRLANARKPPLSPVEWELAEQARIARADANIAAKGAKWLADRKAAAELAVQNAGLTTGYDQ